VSDAVNRLNLDPTSVGGVSPERRRAILRQAVDEMIGVTFYAPMLGMARNNALKGEIGHGGRGEEIFAAQLDMELARRVGQAGRNSLSEAVYSRLVKRV